MSKENSSRAEMLIQLERMKAAYVSESDQPLGLRRQRLDQAIALLVENSDALCEAITEDFGHRSKDQTEFTDIVTSIGALKHAKKHVGHWMRKERRPSEFPLGLLGARSEIRYQPKGVVGIIAPWNFPVSMVFSPLAGALSAGNRVMVKPSEYTPKVSALMAELIEKYFDESVLTAYTGGPQTGADFSSLPFDHLFFTGSTSVGRHVMRAAAENLCPVTLELGGKSPTVLGRSAHMQKAANRIMHGKMLNAGQICVAPDYVFVPQGQEQNFISAATQAVESMFPSGLKDNDDYTSIVNQRHFGRLQNMVEDAREKGAEIIEINPKSENFSQQRAYKMAPKLILNPSDEMAVMQEEIFGPLMPIRSYTHINEVVGEINKRPRPLALYYFGEDRDEEDQVVNHTTAGGVTINDTIFHVAQESLPFGGVGPSGMGHYHGHEGFKSFSHAKAVFRQTGTEMIKLFRPPYGQTFRKQMASRIKF